MKQLLRLVIFGAAAVAGLAQETFSGRMTPEEYSRAGLGKLSPAERSELDALFKKYGGPDGAAPRVSQAPPVRPVPVPAVPEPAPPAKPLASGATGTPTVAPADDGQNKSGGFFRKIRKTATAPAPGPKSEVETIETEVDGTFTGWEEMTVWTMKDGTIWRVDNRPRPYVASRVANPRVKIYPAMFNGYWVEFVELKTRVRVVRLK